MKKWILALAATFSVSANAACLDAAALEKLTQQEVDYLSVKIPPAFKHGLQAGDVKLAVSHGQDEQACDATLQVTVPEAHIQEAQAVLDAQPAKKIMLAAQGYSLPSQTENQADFSVDAKTLKVSDADILQTAALGKLRASIELMYSFITQKRAAIQPGQTNSEAWPASLKTAVVNSCAEKSAASQCACMADEYAKTISAQQMEYIQNVNENPYAAATGSTTGFAALKKEAAQTCAV